MLNRYNTQAYQKLKTKEGQEILRDFADTNNLARFERFKRRAKIRESLPDKYFHRGDNYDRCCRGTSHREKGAQAVGKFSKAIPNIAKKFGPILPREQVGLRFFFVKKIFKKKVMKGPQQSPREENFIVNIFSCVKKTFKAI